MISSRNVLYLAFLSTASAAAILATRHIDDITEISSTTWHTDIHLMRREPPSGSAQDVVTVTITVVVPSPTPTDENSDAEPIGGDLTTDSTLSPTTPPPSTTSTITTSSPSASTTANAIAELFLSNAHLAQSQNQFFESEDNIVEIGGSCANVIDDGIPSSAELSSDSSNSSLTRRCFQGQTVSCDLTQRVWTPEFCIGRNEPSFCFAVPKLDGSEGTNIGCFTQGEAESRMARAGVSDGLYGTGDGVGPISNIGMSAGLSTRAIFKSVHRMIPLGIAVLLHSMLAI